MLFVILTVSTMRMKYLSVPSICVLAGVFLGELQIYKTISFFKLKSILKVN